MEQGDRPGRDVDGVRIVERAPHRRRAGVWAAVVGVVILVAAFTGWTLRERQRTHGVARADRTGAAPFASAGGVVSRKNGTPGSPGFRVSLASAASATDGEDPTPDLSDYVLPGEAPTMGEVIKALHARGIRTGLGAFPPPGTSPPMRGLAVPEGFALPDGYVRHHQVTDDGQTIAPILMFAPDREWIEIRGVRVRVPADRLVPPELAPAGMPLRWVTIPSPRDPGGGP